MADVRISCFLVLCVTVCVGAKTISGKGYYCRDPDTGKLHDVNTTWPSTTFCGNYICKIRKKNHTNTEVQPLRQLNITNRDNKFILTFNSTIENVSQTYPINTSYSVSDTQTNLSREGKLLEDLVREKMGSLNEHLIQGDRYLTEDEIKAFTQILRSMKKSDLEALLEIYNLAQDIYKEIDKATDENIIEETLKDLKENNMSEKIEKVINKSTSYWYEPLAVISNKHRLNENDMLKDSQLMQNVLENLTQGRNNVVATKPKETTSRPPPIPISKPKTETNPSMFFKSTLSEGDIGKLPYFYPISSFQRLSSYINPFPQNSIQSQQKAYNNFQIPPMIQFVPPWYKPYMVPYQNKPLPDLTYNKKVTEAKTVAKIQKVANPVQNNQNNLSVTENSYFNAYPWSLFNLYPPIKKQVPQHLPYVNTGYLSYHLPSAVLMNPEIADIKQDTEVNAMVVPDKKIPDWQTEPLSNNVLDEVRANILMKSKLIPLRKKIKVERIGKVIKLEESRKDRTKREADDFDEYEAYVEKYTCGSDTEPGFFRMGNITEPYPACCPQRIGKGS